MCNYSSICGYVLLGCSSGIINEELEEVKNFGRELVNHLALDTMHYPQM
jgi:hypothetical protein